MNWKRIESTEGLTQAIAHSNEKPVLIYKHSTRCPISAAALARLERAWNTAEMASVEPYFLDLISYRVVSNAVEEQLGIRHESPQALLVHQGKVVYHESHLGISYEELKTQADQLTTA
ncbi:bacillithiol system protein YtxJ [Catalinimonas alkaloidigena]|uniref:Bacillithiol system protein YtxJ n=1 Tax=Catalinimonas alkaloidigena TaxID=1075417 RepID=A0A1G9MKP1_9BACT|nr:bacillithiol system redox-active protein YtxJ [Catalinimonas alkaloidigena]SDL74836.1 bacillithiol system protein YtxJ [Catalinimonas alkaloidigena]